MDTFWTGKTALQALQTLQRDLPPPYTLEQSVSGAPTLTVQQRYIHSRYNPEQEAEKLIQKHQDASAAVVFGSGLGFSILAWLKQHPDKPILVIEPQDCLYCFIQSLIPEQELFFLQREPARDAVHTFLAAIAPAELRSIAILQTQAEVEAEPLIFQKSRQSFIELMQEYMANMYTSAEFEKIWFRNILLNSLTLATSNRLRELDFSTDSAVFLVGAGPGLRAALPHIKRYREQSLVLCADTAAGALQAADITPDIILSLDAQIHNYQDFFHINTEASMLLCDVSVYHSITQLPFKRVVFFETADIVQHGQGIAVISNPLTLRLKQLSGEIGPLRSGGNVISSAVDLLYTLKGATVFLCGCDFSYTNYMVHTPDTPSQQRILYTANRVTTPEQANIRAILKRRLLSVEGSDGKKLLTDTVLHRYAGWIGEAIQETKHWFSLDPSGLPVKGIRQAGKSELAAFFKNRPQRQPSIKAADPEDHSTIVMEALNNLYTAIEDILREASECADTNLAALLAEFLSKHTFLKQIFSAEILHTSRKADCGGFFLEREVLFQLKRVQRYLLSLIG